MKNNKYISMLLLFLASFFWGFAFVAQDLVADIPPITVGMVRWFIGAFFLFFVIMILDKATKSERKLVSRHGLDFTKIEIKGGLATGIIVSVASIFQQMGISQGTSGGKAAFITALYVVLVPIYALVLRKRAKLNVWIAVFVAVIGFYLLCIKKGEGIVPSDFWVIMSAVIYPIHILTIDHFAPKCDCVRMSCLQFAFAFIINTVFALLLEPRFDWPLIFAHIWPFLYLGVVSSGIAYTLQIVGQKNVNPAVASLILSLESVFGLLGAMMILGDKLTVKEYIGAGLIFLAVALSQIEFKSKAAVSLSAEQKPLK
jgi:drug/metabolite transporter (DMT)-like permease